MFQNILAFLLPSILTAVDEYVLVGEVLKIEAYNVDIRMKEFLNQYFQIDASEVLIVYDLIFKTELGKIRMLTDPSINLFQKGLLRDGDQIQIYSLTKITITCFNPNYDIIVLGSFKRFCGPFKQLGDNFIFVNDENFRDPNKLCVQNTTAILHPYTTKFVVDKIIRQIKIQTIKTIPDYITLIKDLDENWILFKNKTTLLAKVGVISKIKFFLYECPSQLHKSMLQFMIFDKSGYITVTAFDDAAKRLYASLYENAIVILNSFLETSNI